MVKSDEMIDIIEGEPTYFSEMASAIFALSPHAIVISRVSDNKIIYFNKEFLNQIGYSKEEVKGHTPQELNLWDQEHRNTYLNKVLNKESVYNIELTHKRKNGTFIDIVYSSRIINVDSEELMLSIGKDITHRKQAEEAFKESEGRYRSLFKNNHAVMLLIKPSTGEIVDANPAAESFYGYDLEELVEMNITDFNVLKDKEVFGELSKAESGENNHFLFKHRLADGEIRDVDVYSGTIIIDDEKLLYSIIHDITRQMEVENALRESEERFRLIFDQSPIGDTIIDLDYHPLRVNNAFSNMLGYSKEELLSMNFEEYTHPEDLEDNLQHLQLLREGEIDYFEMEKRYIRKDDEIVWGHLYASIVRNSSDEPVYILTKIEDITQRKEMQTAIQTSEEKYRTLYETMTQGVIHQDSKGRIISINPAAEEIMGLNSSSMNGETFNYHNKAIHEDGSDFPSENHPSIIALKTGKVVRNVVMGIFNSQKENYNWININATPLFKPGDNKPFQVYITFEDITETMKAHKLLNDTLDELKRSNTELEQFAYVASHDLQEPLRMVSSFTQLLERKYKDSLDAEGLEYINFAVDGAQRMQLLINDLLAYSRVHTKGEKFEDVQLDKVFDDVLFNMEIPIEENNAIITTESLPVISADYSQMVQVFQNLISNAIKYRGQETPQIHVSSQKQDYHWQFSVKDNGIGINPDYYEQVFQIFRRLHTRDEYEGTGIGLAITKRIIERHDGNIWLESKPGEGSIFYFTIPDLLDNNM